MPLAVNVRPAFSEVWGTPATSRSGSANITRKQSPGLTPACGSPPASAAPDATHHFAGPGEDLFDREVGVHVLGKGAVDCPLFQAFPGDKGGGQQQSQRMGSPFPVAAQGGMANS